MVGISIGIRSISIVSIAGLSLSISRPLAVVVGISVGIGSISIVSIAGLGLSISGPLAVVVVSMVGIGMVSIAIVANSVVAGISISLGLSGHSGKEAKSNNSNGLHCIRLLQA